MQFVIKKTNLNANNFLLSHGFVHKTHAAFKSSPVALQPPTPSVNQMHHFNLNHSFSRRSA